MVGHACLSGHRKASTTTGPPPEKFDSLAQASSWYSGITADIRSVMGKICSAKPKRPPEQVKEWDTLISTRAMQARRRTKVFYRRLKSAFAIPRGQPSYPVPSRKIRRILQEPPIWSDTHAFRDTERQARPPDPPPPPPHSSETFPKAHVAKRPGLMVYPPMPSTTSPSFFF